MGYKYDKSYYLGAGKLGRKAYLPLVTKHGVNVIAYVDNCKEKRNETLYGISIVDGETIKKLDFDLVFVALYDYRQIANIK